MTLRNRPVTLSDAPEHRNIAIDNIEMRSAADDDNEYILTGYASTFEEYDMYGGPSQYGWIERIDPNAFDKTLREKPDLHLLVNHEGMPLARTKSGTLDLSVDDHGLKVEARLDKRDPEVQSLAVKMERGDMDEMSFAFRVKAQEWRAAPGFEEIDDQSYRTITEVSLHKGDVSVVNWGANPTTSAGIRSAADLLRAFVDTDEAELRLDDTLIEEVMAKLKPVEEREDEGITEGLPEVGEALDELIELSADLDIETILNVVRDNLDAFRELLLGESEEVVEETPDEEVIEPRGMGLRLALALASSD